MTDVLEIDRRAVAASVDIVGAVDAGSLHLPTPCEGWTLGRLLGHMAGQHHGFAAAARGEGADLSVWADRPVGDDPAGDYAKAADEVVTAFAEEGVLERRFRLPEVHPQAAFPAATAIGFHLLDYVVHGWDVARALGTVPRFDPDLIEAALAVAARVPDGPTRLEPGAAFRPAVPVPNGTSRLDLLLSSLGRSPLWPR
jgi:uncharacterized protein (TIGR03086 family)